MAVPFEAQAAPQDNIQTNEAPLQTARRAEANVDLGLPTRLATSASLARIHHTFHAF